MLRLFRWSVLLVCVIGAARPAAGQTATDERAWFVLTLQERGGTASPWRWSMETIVRSRDRVETLDVVSLRPTIIYTLSSRVSVGGGYAFAPSFPASGGTTVEHRIFGQCVFATPAAGGTVTLRTRVEGRMIEGNSGPLGRLRQQLRFSHPVKKGSAIALVAYDELFLHVNTTTRSPRGVDQNRFFAGISDTLTPTVRFEVGYLNQFSPGHRGAQDKMNHVLSGGLVLSF